DTLVVSWDQEHDSYIIALDAKTGQDKWKTDRDEPTTWTTPVFAEHNGRTQVIVNGTTRIRSYDLATGKLVWQCGGMTVNPIPSLVVNGDHVICMTGYKGSAAVAVPLSATGDVTENGNVTWRHNRGTPYVPSPLLYGGRLYFTQANTGMLSILDA